MFPNNGARECAGTGENRGEKMRKRFINRQTITHSLFIYFLYF